jgi:hypothetical protein
LASVQRCRHTVRPVEPYRLTFIAGESPEGGGALVTLHQPHTHTHETLWGADLQTPAVARHSASHRLYRRRSIQEACGGCPGACCSSELTRPSVPNVYCIDSVRYSILRGSGIRRGTYIRTELYTFGLVQVQPLVKDASALSERHHPATPFLTAKSQGGKRQVGKRRSHA